MIRGITPLNTGISAGIFLGITLGLFLLFHKSYKNKSNIFLGLLVLAYTLFLATPYLYGARLLESFPHIIRVGAILITAVGPLIWFYVVACTQKRFQMRPILWLHFLPLLINIIYSLPFLLSSGPEKYTTFLQFVEKGTYGVNPIEPSLKIIHLSVYFFLACRVIFRYRNHLNATSSSIDKAYQRWLLLFSLNLMFPIIALLLVVLTNYQFISGSILVFSFFAFIIGVYLAVLFKPEIFHTFPNRMPVINIAEEEKQKYERSNLQDAQKEKLVKKLIQYVESKKPYQEPELTLGELSRQVDIPIHYLSQIINEKINQSFLEFINSYRVEAAKKMLSSEKYDHYTIIAIAFEADFNSKTAFYTAFKKFTDTTPSKYRKSLTNK